MASATAMAAAQWMASKLLQDSILYQQDAVVEIESQFGDDTVYFNDRGNPAISPAVLKEFKKLTEKNAVWNRAERYWRIRDTCDDPNRRMTDY